MSTDAAAATVRTSIEVEAPNEALLLFWPKLTGPDEA